MAPTATASRTPVCAPCAAAMMMFAGFSSPSSCTITGSSSGCGLANAGSPSANATAGTSGIMILAINIPPGADMNAAASR